MATFCLLRSMQSSAAARTFGPQLLSRAFPAAPTIQKKCLQLSPASKARDYGPLEEVKIATSHWKTERIVAIAMIPVIPASIMFPNVVLDTALATTLMLHTHWGFNGALNDYVHNSTVHGSTLPKILHSSLLVISILAFGGLCYLNYFDCGFGNAVRLLFSEL